MVKSSLSKKAKTGRDSKPGSVSFASAGGTPIVETSTAEMTTAETPTAETPTASETAEMSQGRKRKASVSTTSLESTDPQVLDWNARTHYHVLKATFKVAVGSRGPYSEPPEEAIKQFGSEKLRQYFGFLSSVKGKLLDLYYENPNHYFFEYEAERRIMEEYVSIVLKSALKKAGDPPFVEEQCRLVVHALKLRNWRIQIKDYKLTDFYAAIDEFNGEDYWVGVRKLYPALRRKLSAKDAEWLRKAAEERAKLVEDWESNHFVSGEVIPAVLTRIAHVPDPTNPASKQYAKILPVIQASGYGKSRLLKQLVHIIPGIYVNLSESPKTVPVQDDGLVRWLGSKGDRRSTTKYLCLLHALFMISFQNLESLIASPPKVHSNSPLKTTKELADCFQRRLDSSGDRDVRGSTRFPKQTATRLAFNEKVVKLAEEMYEKLEHERAWTEEGLSGPANRRDKELNKLIRKEFLSPWNLKLQYLKQCNLSPSNEVLLADPHLAKPKHPGDCFSAMFLFAVDELTELELSTTTRETKLNTWETARHSLERAASLLHSLDVWFIYATPFPHSDIQRTSEHPSDRIKYGRYTLPKPFCSLPLHLGLTRQMANSKAWESFMKKPMIEFSTVAHMTLYGRPLWETYRNEDENVLNESLFNRFMVIDTNNPSDFWKVDTGNPAHVYSVIAVRAFLDPIIGQNISMSLLRESVVKHLCPVREVDPDYGIIQLDQYNDPPLANAVTAFFTREKSNWSALINGLSNRLIHFPVRDLKGERGELFVRLIFLIARDRAWQYQKDFNTEKRAGRSGAQQAEALALKTDERISCPILLSHFLRSILAVGDWMRISGTKIPAGGANRKRTVANILENAYINFTHFAASEHPLNPETLPSVLHRSLSQNAAIICKPGQAAWDFVIPYYKGDPTEEFKEKSMSAIAIQVKNQGAPRPEFLNDFPGMQGDNPSGVTDFQWGAYFKKLDLDKAPLITILCEAGREPSRNVKNVDLIPGYRKVFALRMIGATKETYGCLEGDSELQNAFAAILGADSFNDNSGFESRIILSHNNVGAGFSKAK